MRYYSLASSTGERRDKKSAFALKTQYLSVRDLMCMHLYISIMSFIESNSQRLDKTVGSKHTHTNTKKHLAACYKQAECLCLCL